MAGALFENFCVQETVKLFCNKAVFPRLFYLRANNNLEIDLLIEKSLGSIVPVEIKFHKTPNMAMGSNLQRFRKTFSGLDIDPGLIVSLVDKETLLGPDIAALPFDEYLQKVEDLISGKNGAADDA